MYSDKVIDHFQNPRNVGEIEDASGVGTVGNAKCGDMMRLYLKINEEQVIIDCKFKTYGCGAAVASSSMATEMIKGKTVAEALFPACRRNTACSFVGLCRKTWNQDSGTCKTGTGY